MPEPPQSAYVAQYVPGLIRLGLSANQALLYLQGRWENMTAETRGRIEAAGMHPLETSLTPRRQTFLRLYAETRAALDRREQVIHAELGRRPAAAEISKWPARRPGGYLYQVEVAVRKQATGEVYFTPSAYFASRLVTYGEAASEATNVFLQAQLEDRSFEGEQILGPMITGVFEFVPEEV